MDVYTVGHGAGTAEELLTTLRRAQIETLVDVRRWIEIVRLGQGVDRTGRLHPDALHRTIAVARDYGESIREAGA